MEDNKNKSWSEILRISLEESKPILVFVLIFSILNIQFWVIVFGAGSVKLKLFYIECYIFTWSNFGIVILKAFLAFVVAFFYLSFFHIITNGSQNFLDWLREQSWFKKYCKSDKDIIGSLKTENVALTAKNKSLTELRDSLITSNETLQNNISTKDSTIEENKVSIKRLEEDNTSIKKQIDKFKNTQYFDGIENYINDYTKLFEDSAIKRGLYISLLTGERVLYPHSRFLFCDIKLTPPARVSYDNIDYILSFVCNSEAFDLIPKWLHTVFSKLDSISGINGIYQIIAHCPIDYFYDKMFVVNIKNNAEFINSIINNNPEYFFHRFWNAENKRPTFLGRLILAKYSGLTEVHNLLLTLDVATQNKFKRICDIQLSDYIKNNGTSK